MCFKIIHLLDVRDALMLNDYHMLNEFVPSVNVIEYNKIGKNFYYLYDDKYILQFYIQKIISEVKLPNIYITF
jgi:hypothetical protein